MNELDIKWPDGFNWWTVERNGACSFWEFEPLISQGMWTGGAEIEDPNPPDTTGLDWKESLRERPSNKDRFLKDLDEHKSEPLYLEDTPTPTLRDQFAVAALTGFLANKATSTNFNPDDDANYIYKIADAMMKRRET